MNCDDKIYIPGHTGMVGSALMRALRRRGFSRLIARPFDELDLLDQSAVRDFFRQEQPDYVFLAAAKVGGIVANNTYRGQFIYENLQIQNNVIHHAHLAGVKKLLFLGSSCIYPKHAPQPISEAALLTGPLEATNEPYAVAKIAGIKMCQAYRAQYGCNFIAVMPTNLYGPNDNFDLETSHVLPALIRRFFLAAALERGDWQTVRTDLDRRPINGVTGAADEQIIIDILAKHGIRIDHGPSDLPLSPFDLRPVTVTLWGTGSPRREFMHVDDLADACLYLMDHYDEPEIVNIGVGEDLTIAELADSVRAVCNSCAHIHWDGDKPDGTPRKLLNVAKLQALGWHATITLKDGIRRTLEWYRASLTNTH